MKGFGEVTALVLAGSLAAAGAWADEAREIKKVLPLDADGSLSVEAYKGSITVTGAAGAGASVEARIVPDGDDEASLRRAKETDVRIEGGGRSVSVRTDDSHVRRQSWFSDEGSAPMVHYTIRMPATARLSVNDYKSATRLSGLKSDLTVKTYKGTVDVSGHEGAVSLETYKGEVTIAFVALSKPVRLETYKGEIGLRLPAASAFELDADIGRKGDFHSDFDVVMRSHGGSHGRIHGTVNGGGPKISFETDKGSLRLVKQ